jgi:hypothetical protein
MAQNSLGRIWQRSDDQIGQLAKDHQLLQRWLHNCLFARANVLLSVVSLRDLSHVERFPWALSHSTFCCFGRLIPIPNCTCLVWFVGQAVLYAFCVLCVSEPGRARVIEFPFTEDLSFL